MRKIIKETTAPVEEQKEVILNERIMEKNKL